MKRWGGLSSLDKLGDKDKSVDWHIQQRLFSKEDSAGKQATNITYNSLGATAEMNSKL